MATVREYLGPSGVAAFSTAGGGGGVGVPSTIDPRNEPRMITPPGQQPSGVPTPRTGPSRAESRFLDLINNQIQESIRIQAEENRRAAARRASLEQLLGMPLEAFEAQEAMRAFNISRLQSERLEKGLRGELPVDPALERNVGESETTLRQKLLNQLGPGWETSTPGIQALEEHRKRSEELRSAARHGLIAEGIGPATATAQFGLNLLGREGVEDIPALRAAMSAATSIGNRDVLAGQINANTLLGLRELATRERIAQLQADTELQSANIRADASRGTQGGGVGSLIGLGIGTAAATAPWWLRYFTGGGGTRDPLNWWDV